VTEETGFAPEPEPGTTRAGSVTVGERVRAAREDAGLSQEALGAKLGVTQTAVSYWEAGKRDPGVADLLRIADALSVTASSLLPLPHQEAAPGSSLPDGEWARVEIMGHDSHTGWVTDGTRGGAPVMVISDWDGRVTAEVPGTSLYRFVPLPTPLKRPEAEPARALPAGRGYSYEQYPDEGPW
jgi:transcriptional regulator with XRE-family HTH domain